MGRYFALTIGSIPSQVKAKSKEKRAKPMPKLGFWVISLLIVTALIYLIQVNGISTKGYDIKKLEQKITELKETGKRLELEAASLKSIQNVETQIKSLNLVPSGVVKYVSGNEYTLLR